MTWIRRSPYADIASAKLTTDTQLERCLINLLGIADDLTTVVEMLIGPTVAGSEIGQALSERAG